MTFGSRGYPWGIPPGIQPNGRLSIIHSCPAASSGSPCPAHKLTASLDVDKDFLEVGVRASKIKGDGVL